MSYGYPNLIRLATLHLEKKAIHFLSRPGGSLIE
jgi:hypothetical protein